MTTAIVLAVIAVILVIVGVVMYNSLISRRNRVEEAWGQIDVQLKRRADLIPNLVETVKGYAKHESETLNEVTEARTLINNASSTSTAGAVEGSALMDSVLGRLFAVAESYPDLKASQNFQSLQEELATTENKVSFARQHYNVSVRELNTKIQTVPTNIIANIAGVKEREYFNLPEGDTDRDPVKVTF